MLATRTVSVAPHSLATTTALAEIAAPTVAPIGKQNTKNTNGSTKPGPPPMDPPSNIAATTGVGDNNTANKPQCRQVKGRRRADARRSTFSSEVGRILSPTFEQQRPAPENRPGNEPSELLKQTQRPSPRLAV